MTVGRLIKAGLMGVTVFLWILMAGLLTGCGSRSGEIAEEPVKDRNRGYHFFTGNSSAVSICSDIHFSSAGGYAGSALSDRAAGCPAKN